jgi:DNA-binding LytR/AlgR family response regulator
VTALRQDAARPPATTGDDRYDGGIWVPQRHGAVWVPVDTIDWIEAARDYAMLNTPLKSHILRATMNELQERLDPALMIRVHRSHIVRIAAVKGVERPGRGLLRLVLADGNVLQVGPSYVDTVSASLRLN